MKSISKFGCLWLSSLILALAAWAQTAPPMQSTPPQSQTAPQSATMNQPDAATALHRDMRKLWTDHTVWTRNFIISATENKPDTKAVTDRLLKNQDDIGAAVAQYYGAPAGEKLTGLLKQHILIAADLVKAAAAKDKAKQTDADNRWHKNAEELADFLSSANPNWPRATLVDLLNTHLSTTADELNARLKKDWDADIKAYDAVYQHILKISDALSDGIVKQFPQKFSGSMAAGS